MRLFGQMMLGAAAVLTATAASVPNELGDLYYGNYPNDLHQREALNLCAAHSAAFVRFFASDREDCYRQMRGVSVAVNYSGVWSKPDRAHPVYAQD
jgi:hypothetical protein